MENGAFVFYLFYLCQEYRLLQVVTFEEALMTSLRYVKGHPVLISYI